MARKKERRPNLPQEALVRARAELVTEGGKGANSSATLSADAKPVFKPKVTYKAVTIDDLRAEYTHVIADLRSMAFLVVLLAVAMVIGAQLFV